MQWLSAYIYGDISNATKWLLGQLIDEVKLNYNLERYFFIYYFEEGPHIRLRLLIEEKNLLNIQELIDARVHNFFNLFPSTDLNRVPTWRPNNSLHYIDYDPEYERYGGTKGVEISEWQFTHSTRSVIAYTRQNQLNSYNDSLNVSIRLHIVLACVLFDNLQGMIDFFDFTFGIWSQHKHVNKEKYNRMFAMQEQALISYVEILMRGLEEGIPFEDDVLNSWKDAMYITKEKLNSAFKSNELKYVHRTLKNPLWLIVQSYVHMTNNRLGVRNIDEPLMIFFIVESLRKYGSK